MAAKFRLQRRAANPVPSCLPRTAGEQGLLGVALHPNYPASPYLYAYATRQVGGVARNQVLKITISNGVGVASQVIVEALRKVYKADRVLKEIGM